MPPDTTTTGPSEGAVAGARSAPGRARCGPPVQIATLMAVYGGDDPGLFRAALESVATQSFRTPVDSRLYLGVDGPVGAALEAVIDEHRTAIHFLNRSPANRGLAATLNTLIAALAEEQYVFRMDADDVSLPGRYQAQLDYLHEHAGVDILGTAITEVDAVSGTERVVRFARDPDDALANLHRRVPVAHPTVCFRRRVLDAVGGYPVRGTNEDIALWFACARLGFRFDNLPGSFLRFRISPGFWRRRGMRKALSELGCYVRGIRDVYGAVSLRYIFPLGRFAVRMSPPFISRWVYGARFRTGKQDSPPLG
jgi:glycosyltransferase involved in cell wall biosynthesis